MSSPLRASIITLSVLNPQTNQYQQMGQIPIIVMRINGKLQIILMRSKTQPLMAIDPSENNNWVISNDVYATFTDKNGRVWLFLFKSAEETLIFTMVALYGTAKLKNGSPITIVNKGGNQIEPTHDISVDYKIYSLKESNLDNPNEQQGVNVGFTESSPLRNLFNGGYYGATHLLFYEEDIICIATVSDPNPPAAPKETPQPAQSLPQIGNSESNQPKVEQPKQQEKPIEQPKQVAAAPKEEIKPKQTETPKQNPPAEIKVKEETKVPVVEEKPKYIEEKPKFTNEKPKLSDEKQKTIFDAQLDQIRSEMYGKFNELSKMVAAIKRQQASRAATPQSSDILIASVERLVKENEAKDRLIAEKQQLIEMLNAKKNDTRERDELRKQLAELTAKVSKTKEQTKKKQEEKKELEKRIEALKKKVSAAKSDSESKLASIRRELESERQRQMQDLEQSKQQLQWNVNKSEEEIKELRKKLTEAEELNKELKEKSGVDSAKELEKLKAAADQLLVNTVKKMVSGVYQNCQKIFSGAEFDGAQVIKGVRAALQAQAEEILSELE
ncbi:hypothetical protein TVAG_439410 [Trichomonas vaginalis G3]|uniref:Uncharacterized protein n=1 Tax=Trichomonas vaginalis (strain ATCC PRA-98 / G3) TaxID=412133 RepID=A2FAG0_TRIV3|nr:hypothetical protein TVAGG3_0911520 [Trichomonas vaginalis G3]EAX98097.1 hypothetical protein TVAG_439410 [Trichomonas vaginalis G3]KAI5484463.1 hypothetical protein TVAGG3_0911520 [Trichomonas vaginalis G3]|eukprot:XP_001311027.1 hypothetical protein [Trichomonas vaginalis G3]